MKSKSHRTAASGRHSQRIAFLILRRLCCVSAFASLVVSSFSIQTISIGWQGHHDDAPAKKWRYRRSIVDNSSLQRRRHFPQIFQSFDDEDFTSQTPPKMKEEEETLLTMSLSVHNHQSLEMAADAVQEYIRSFPFAVVLPVQPLTYLPHESGERGVRVTFLRKKTKEKGSMDGGIDFTVVVPAADDGRITVVATRNSKGQTVGKVFSEMLIVRAFVKDFAVACRRANEKEEGGDVTMGDANKLKETIDRVESVFHKWM